MNGYKIFGIVVLICLFFIGGYITGWIANEDTNNYICDTSNNVKVVYDVSKCPEVKELELTDCSSMLIDANEALRNYDYYKENIR